MRTYTAAHEPLFDELRAANAFAINAEAMLDLVDRHVTVSGGEIAIREADGSVALDPNNAYQPHTAGSFVRHLRSVRADLFDKHVASSRKPVSMPTAVPDPSETMSQRFAKAKAGDATARAILDAGIHKPVDPATALYARLLTEHRANMMKATK